MDEINVGLAGLASALLLAACAPSAPLLMATGGSGHVSRGPGVGVCGFRGPGGRGWAGPRSGKLADGNSRSAYSELAAATERRRLAA